MADLFDGIKMLSDNEIRMQLALFETVNFGNAVKETGYRFLAGLTDVVNAFAGMVSTKEPFEYELKKVSDMAHDRYLRYAAVGRSELDKMLKTKLIEQGRGIAGEEVSVDTDHEKLSLIIINSAAAGLNINKYITPAHKIEEIGIRYNSAFIANLHSYLVKMTESECREASQMMDMSLGMADMEVKRSVHKCLMPESFNGAGVIKVLRRQKKTDKLESVIECLGMEAFPYLDAEVRTIYQALRTLNRISDVQLARLVWKAAKAYGRKFYVREELLPSYISADIRAEEDAKEKVFRALIGQLESVRGDVGKCEREIENKERRLNETKAKMEEVSNQLEQSRSEFEQLEQKKDAYMNNAYSDQETRSYYSRVNEVKRRLDRAEEEYGRWEHKLNEQTGDVSLLNSKLEVEKDRLETAEREADEKISEYAAKVRRNWVAYFFKFRFTDEIFKQIVIEFTRKELVYIEGMLKEMHDAKDMHIFLDKDNKVYVYIGKKAPAVIIYNMEEEVFESVSRG